MCIYLHKDFPSVFKLVIWITAKEGSVWSVVFITHRQENHSSVNLSVTKFPGIFCSLWAFIIFFISSRLNPSFVKTQNHLRYFGSDVPEIFTTIILLLAGVGQYPILRRICGPKRDTNGVWRRLHNEELHSLYRWLNIVRVIKSRILRWAGLIARMEQGSVL